MKYLFLILTAVLLAGGANAQECDPVGAVEDFLSSEPSLSSTPGTCKSQCSAQRAGCNGVANGVSHCARAAGMAPILIEMKGCNDLEGDARKDCKKAAKEEKKSLNEELKSAHRSAKDTCKAAATACKESCS